MKTVLKNIFITLLLLALAYLLSDKFFELKVTEHISTIFAFAVFAIALFTSSYIYGVVASFIAVILINYAYTAPYFAFDFIRPINFISGAVMLAISIVTSLLVTRNKQHQKREREAEKETMRANLLRAVSHDLRTPLTTINTASSLLLESDNLTERQKKEMLKKINDDSAWLTRMVENLLSVTRIDNDGMNITRTPTILDELIDSVITKFQSSHPEEKVEVELPDDIVIISVDPILISQVLINLLENSAVHAEGHTGIFLTVKERESDVLFTVSDDGCGIDEKKLKNIFTMYGHIGDRNAEGRYAGIGLAVCQTIINAHGGTIKAENRKNGAAFTFTLEKEKE